MRVITFTLLGEGATEGRVPLGRWERHWIWRLKPYILSIGGLAGVVTQNCKKFGDV
ncbi:hypothetical protein KPHES18084_18430 [Corynebacterium ulcerans]|nr:hypothetical protein CULTSU28_19530 [Corynebacterium ulcerans]